MPAKSYQSGPVDLVYSRSITDIVVNDHVTVRSAQYNLDDRLATIFGVVGDRSWTRTSGFRAAKARGELPMNPLVVNRLLHAPAGSLIGAGGSAFANEEGDYTDNRWTAKYPVGVLYSPGQVKDLVDFFSLDSKLVGKIKGRTPEWNAPVFLGEARETVEMVVKTARTLQEVMVGLRRGRIDYALKHLGLTSSNRRVTRDWNRRVLRDYTAVYPKDPSKAAANAWLQLQYGWKPLLSDVKSAAEVLASHMSDNRFKLGRVSVSQKASDFGTRAVPYSGVPAGSGTLSFFEEYTDSVRYVVYYRPDEVFDSLGQVGLLNPALVAWELLPLSFVADWFLPIGNYLSGLDVGMRYNFVKGLQSRKQEVTGVLRGHTGNWKWDGSPASYTRTYVRAQPMGSIPTPRASQLWFNPSLGASRIASGLALLRQSFTGLKR